MKILRLGAEALSQKAVPVKEITAKYRAIAAQMIELMIEGKGVGLAGPQIGLMERMFVVKCGNEPPRVFINPTIMATSEDQAKYEEGCMSLPGVWADVIRPVAVTVQAWNEKGRPFTLNATGMLARIIQHEYDHLNGVLFIDHLSDFKKRRLITQYEKLQTRRDKYGIKVCATHDKAAVLYTCINCHFGYTKERLIRVNLIGDSLGS